MRVFEVKGELLTHADQDHQEILTEIYMLLKEKGYHFQGLTKEVTKDK